MMRREKYFILVIDLFHKSVVLCKKKKRDMSSKNNLDLWECFSIGSFDTQFTEFIEVCYIDNGANIFNNI